MTCCHVTDVNIQGNSWKAPKGTHISCVVNKHRHSCLYASNPIVASSGVWLWRLSCFIDFGSFGWGCCIQGSWL